MSRKVQISGISLILALALASSGCAQFLNQLKGQPPKDQSKAKVEQAIKEGDLPTLKTACSDKKIDGVEIGYRDRKNVCAETGKLMSAEMATLQCDKIDAYWTEGKEIYSDVKEALHNPYGLKLAECDRWETIWTELMHWGQAWDRGSSGYKLVKKLDEAGHPVEDNFVAYLDTSDKPLDIEHAGYAMTHFLKWRLDTEEGKSCDAYVPAMDKLNASASHYLLVYLKEVECAAAADAAAKMLAADGHNTRQVACQLLGKVGDSGHLKKVEIIAQKDGYSVEKSRTVVYPVRDACSQAQAKIELRQ